MPSLIAPDYKQKKAAKKGFFPPVGTVEDAEHAVKQGWMAAYFVAGVTAILTLIVMNVDSSAVKGLDAWAFLDVGIMLACGIGMQKWKSRAAAVIALLVFAYGKIYSIQVGQNVSIGGWIVAALLLLCFVNGVRGTFAYQKQKAAGGAQKA